MKLLELYCGSKSISKVAESMGIQTFTSDVNKRFKPDYLVSIFNFDINTIPFNPDIIWASPPCECFSVASIWRHWNKDGTPKSIFLKQSLIMIKITLDIIKTLQPRYWFIENPRGMLRKQSMMSEFMRHTVSYCQYEDNRMKPTDIWTNNHNWKPKVMCKPGASCHDPKGTHKLDNRYRRAVIPELLCKEILESCTNNICPGQESAPNNISVDRQLKLSFSLPGQI